MCGNMGVEGVQMTLGHPSYDCVQTLAPHGIISGLPCAVWDVKDSDYFNSITISYNSNEILHMRATTNTGKIFFFGFYSDVDSTI